VGVIISDVIERIKNGELSVVRSLKGELIAIKSNFPFIRDEDAETELLQLAKLGQQMQWISVTDRLPTEEKFYFARYEDGRVSTGTFFKDLGRFNRGVTHWMPVPPNPKEA